MNAQVVGNEQLPLPGAGSPSQVNLSHSADTKLKICPRQYRYHYVDRIRTKELSINLAIGSSIDEACSAYITGHALGVTVDPVPIFERTFEQFQAENVLAYSTKFDSPGTVLSMGRVMLQRFIAKWDELGFVALLDPNGKPLVQLELKVKMPGNILFTGILDVIVMTPDGRVVILDLKTPSDAAEEHFVLNSSQLCGYQYCVEACKDALGIDHVDGVGFLELVKKPLPKTAKGSGPVIHDPQINQPFSAQALAEFVVDIQWDAEQIRRKHFPKRALDAYNTPCGMCDMRNLCTMNSMSGLYVDNRPKRRQTQQVSFVSI